MIVVDARECAKQVKDFAEKSKLNLHKMVERFALHLAQTASNNTPIGDAEEIADWYASGMKKSTASKYVQYYIQRKKDFGIGIQVGYHRGAWEYSESGQFTFDREIKFMENKLTEIVSDFSANYKLGDTFYIGATGPGYSALEKGSSKQAPLGIIKPTVDEVVQAYSANLQHFYRSN